MVEGFEHRHVGLALAEQGLDLAGEVGQASRQRRVAGQRDAAVVDAFEPRAAAQDQPVAGEAAAGVEPEDAQDRRHGLASLLPAARGQWADASTRLSSTLTFDHTCWTSSWSSNASTMASTWPALSWGTST